MRQPSARLAWAAWAALCLLPILACNFGRANPAAAPAATPTPEEPVPYYCSTAASPTEADRQHVSDFHSQLFDDNSWRKQIMTYDEAVNVIWRDPDTGGVALIQYRVFGCPYTSANVLDLYREAVFRESVYGAYADVQVLERCTAGDLTLQTFSGDYEQAPYLMYFWIVPESNTRLLTVSLVMPAQQPGTLRRYAEALFPDLSACPAN